MSAAYLKAFVSYFLKTYQTLLRPELAETAHEQLYELAVEFGRLATRLLSLPSVISCHGIDHFQTVAFGVESAETDVARVVPLEEHDSSLDGRPIPLVVQPMIVGHGTAEGKSYSQRKVWSKAVVWVSSKADPQETRAVQDAGVGGELSSDGELVK